ncbi:ogr/Delta-like zinc finger family protein [uncultured Desulfobacter sp.]|uniref:ogr/Delta-like zinc finger family protein n=1 Tax=uncultured Desulfobacter sp. TaxID=240139 RepID=UPI0029F4F24C|nr:ogr/Delta-like zinc finger family protein [uncultured Desulfobacter sp.]
MAVKVTCNRCGCTATISSSSIESDEVKRLYCCCKNADCGHTFVMDLSFSHTLSPSALDIPDEVLTRLHTSTRCEQQKIFSRLAVP